MLLQWYESFSGREDNHSPAWLLEHEKELEFAKKSRQRKNSSKKSKRKGSNKKQSSQRLPEKADENAVQRKSQSKPIGNTNKGEDSGRADAFFDSDKYVEDDDPWESYYHRPQTHTGTGYETRNKDHDNTAKEHHDGVPSSISIFSTSSSSYTVSNTEHSEDRNLSDSTSFDNRTPPPITSQSRTLNHQPLLMNSPPRKPLLVPTQEQRNQAAQRLREFQNAQIQRLMYRKKLSQSLKVSSNSAVTSTSTAIVSPPNSSLSSPQTQLLKPPPGFGRPSDIPTKSDMLEDTFFADNELLLSKLLDDDDNADDDVLSTDSGINSFPQESSLDPAAAPFVLEGFDGKEMPSPVTESKLLDSNWDMSHGRPMPSLSDKGHTMIKGVYGGSVW
jgi:hypothetical protein